jgi:hypothetical protein
MNTFLSRLRAQLSDDDSDSDGSDDASGSELAGGYTPRTPLEREFIEKLGSVKK